MSVTSPLVAITAALALTTPPATYGIVDNRNSLSELSTALADCVSVLMKSTLRVMTSHEDVVPSKVLSWEGAEGQGDRSQPGSGAAVVWTVDPHSRGVTAITNFHVVAGRARVWVQQICADRGIVDAPIEASVMGSDEQADLAVLQFTVPESQPLALRAPEVRSHRATRVGELSVAIGTPFDLGGSVTLGIISSRARLINGRPFIQTDAAVNAGNSGGPLFGIDGRLLGINSQILGPNNLGVAFAIPAELSITIARKIRAKAERGQLGIYVRDTRAGVVVAEGNGRFSPSSSGLKAGDEVLAAGPDRAGLRPITSVFDLLLAATEAEPGSTLLLLVRREGESTLRSVAVR